MPSRVDILEVPKRNGDRHLCFPPIESDHPHHSLTRVSHDSLEPDMLVLSRHRDESIMIGDDVVITIVDIRGDKVRLGIKAPQEIPVHREEVYDAIKRENEGKSQATPNPDQVAAPSPE